MCQSAFQDNALPTVKDGNGSTAGEWLHKKECGLNGHRVPGLTTEITHLNQQRYFVDLRILHLAIYEFAGWEQGHQKVSSQTRHHSKVISQHSVVTWGYKSKSKESHLII